MVRLRTRTELRGIGDDIAEAVIIGLFTAIIVGGLVIGISALCTGQHSADFSQAQSNRTVLNGLLSADHTPAYRRQKAAELLKFREEGLVAIMDQSYYGSSQVTDQVVNAVMDVAETGRPLHLETHHYSWHVFRDILWFTLLSMFLLWSLVAFIRYCYDNDDNYYLVDLPWRQVWPVFFIALTVLPMGLPFYVVSGIRTYRARRQDEVETPAELPLIAVDVWDEAELLPVGLLPIEPAQPPARLKFHSAPKAAKQQYVALRTRTWREQRASRRVSLSRRLDSLAVDLQDLGTAIRLKQTERGNVAAELQQLEAFSTASTEIPGQEHLDAEFDRLMALPGVAGVRVINDQICLLLKARLEYQGIKYDLGDWELRFGAESSLTTIELRSGVRKSWGTGYPVYRVSGDFCFGHRGGTIYENLQKGQFLEAIELAVDCMQSVNDEDLDNIPEAFKKAKDEKKEVKAK